MSNLNEEDIAKALENESNIEVLELLTEWEDLVDELTEKEIALFKWKEIYNIKSLEIENNTDFKSLYGKNNEKIRKEHIKNELSEWHYNIKDLEFSIDWISRRISLLRETVKVKRVLLEAERK